MKTTPRKSTTVWAVAAIIVFCSTVSAQDEVNVGFFPAWPTPNLVGMIDGTFDRELGVPLNWKLYESSQDMNRAFSEGTLDIAIGHEIVPFLQAAGNDLPIVAVGIAVSYPEYDNCVLSAKSGITRENVKQLEGQTAYTISGTISHFRMLKMLDFLEVDHSKMELIFVGDGTAVSKAVHKGWAALGCAYAGPLQRMLDNGQALMTGQELESIGLKYFDLVTMSRSFLEVNRETARKFMSITDRFNQQYTAQPGPMKSAIAEGSGIRVTTANRLLQQFSFPAASEQKTVQWLGAGGLVENYLKELAAFLALHENLENPIPGYGNYIDAGLLE